MVAYSFQDRFLPAIRSREKQQTIRLPRKRHAMPGEALQMFNGPRMRPTRVGAASCLNARQVRLDFDRREVVIDEAIVICTTAELDAFAIRDGFNPAALDAPPSMRRLRPWLFMGQFWLETHPDKPVFAGVLIDWGETFIPHQLAAAA